MTGKNLFNRLSRLEKRNLRKSAKKERVHIYDPLEGLDTYLAGLPRDDTEQVHIYIPDNGRGAP